MTKPQACGNTLGLLTNRQLECFMATVNLTAQTVRELLDYAPETGVLKWRVNRPPRGIAGSVAGCVMRNGYIAISFHGCLLYTSDAADDTR